MRLTSGLVVLLLAGCATNTTIVPVVQQQAPSAPRLVAVPVRRHGPSITHLTAAAGARVHVVGVLDLAADCSSLGEATMRLASAPVHGGVSIEHGLFHSNYPVGNQRYACNLTPTPGVTAFYRSEPGYVGEDEFALEVFTPDGRSGTLRYHLDVK